MRPIACIDILWGVWWASWLIAAIWSQRTLKRVTARRQILHRVPTLAGFILLFGFYAPLHIGRTWAGAVGAPWGWGLAVLCAAGLCFCWWARLHLGRLWSSAITHKADHALVDTGPYALVRHPIYTGLLTAALATALCYATVLAAIGFGLIVLGFYVKARQEEQLLRDELGAPYAAYAASTPMLVPGVRITSARGRSPRDGE